MEKLIATAQGKASERGGTLRGLKVRLGAMATSTPEHFRDDFVHVRDELGLGDIELTVETAPERPAGVELLSVEISE